MFLRRIFLSFSVLAGFTAINPPALAAIELNATPLAGPGDYEFLFFSAERKVEIDGLVKRFGELNPELEALQAQLKNAEAEVASLSNKGPGKKSQRLDWSSIEGATGYSVKLFDAKKSLIGTFTTEENNYSAELEPGEYFFQVAAVTKYKTGAYSRMTSFRVSRGKPGAAQLAAEEKAEGLREKIRIQRSIRGEYLKTLRSMAVGTANATDAKADVSAPESSAIFVAVNRKSEPYTMSSVAVIPGRSLNAATARMAEPVVAVSEGSKSFYWGAGLLAGIQDTKLDFFRVSFGGEGFVRYDRAYLKFFYPQIKTQVMYSGAKTNVYDAMLTANLYPGVYYPFRMGKVSLLLSISTGANWFVVLASAGSASVLQWGFMPAVELQYSLSESMSLYAGGAINFTYDTSATFLKFVPFNLGLTRRF